MTLVKACSVSDVPPGSLKWVRVSGKDLLIANLDGKFHALDNWCTHERGNLADGQLSGSIVTCPEHGAQFDITTGKVLLGPDESAPESIPVQRTYRTQVNGDDVLVDMP